MLAAVKNADSGYWYLLKQGDANALGFLYDNYVDKLFAAALRITDNRELAKDAVQEVFIEIWHYRYSITEIQHSQTYLIKVLRSILLKKIKKENIFKYFPLDDTFCSPEQTIERIIIDRDIDKEKKYKLNNALSKLSIRQKQVLDLHFYKGLSYELIAEKLNINYQSVNNLCFRSILRLRNLMFSILFCICL